MLTLYRFKPYMYLALIELQLCSRRPFPEGVSHHSILLLPHLPEGLELHFSVKLSSIKK